MNIKVLKHEGKKSGYFHKHKALIELEGVEDVKKEEIDIIYELSIQVNYHPHDYGLYGGKISKSSKENQYIVAWETGAN